MSTKEKQGGLGSSQVGPGRGQKVQDDGLDLVDCCLVLMRRKWLILVGSLVPALIIGAVLFVQPGEYRASYTYRMALSETDVMVLEHTLYSADNIARLVDALSKHKLDAKVMEAALALLDKEPSEVISFKISPSFADVKTRNFEELQHMRSAQGSLLTLHIQSSSTALEHVATIGRTNFEQAIHVTRQKEELVRKIVALRNNLANIEETRYLLSLQLQRKLSGLDKLRKAKLEASGKAAGDVILQFNIGSGESDYLPLSYQVQAAQTQIIHLEEEIQTNIEKYAYYGDLLSVNETLLERLTKASEQSFAMGRFHASLIEELAGYTEEMQHVRDSLAAYVKHIENEMAAVVPVVDKPAVHAVARRMVIRTGLVFAIACLLSIFAAFMGEGLRRKRLAGHIDDTARD